MATKKSSNHYFQVRRSGIHGKGGFALRRIRPGTRVIEYTGEHVSHKDGDKRYPIEKGKRHHTFLFVLDNKTCVDAGSHGNAARFLNHSCDPNCEAYTEDGHIWINAIKNIQPGAELTYDYGLTGGQPRTKAEWLRYACECGASNCRGTMVAKPEKKKKHKARKK